MLAQDFSAVCFDAIRDNVRFIPGRPFAVGGYINGAISPFVWTQAEWDRFRFSYHIRINVTGDPARGNALDVERGDATPANVQGWIETRGPQTEDPLIVYANGSNVAPCVAARNAAHEATGHFAWIWEATLDGTISGHAMTQFAQTRLPSGAAVTDVSLITDAHLLAAMSARAGHQ